MGYHQAGFTEIVGVDKGPQPRYPFRFVQGDALEYLAAHGHEFDMIHASPPCQAHTRIASIWRGRINYDERHADLIPQTRELLRASGRPYVIENVEGSPLESPVLLCGEMFGLRVIRHRLFETSVFLLGLPHVPHRPGGTNSHRGLSTGGAYVTVGGHNFIVDEGRAAMGIDWMIGRELAQAIPPAYTKWIGQQMLYQMAEYQGAR